MKNAALSGKPYAGNPHVRFEVGEVASYPPTVGRPEGVAMRGAKPRRGSLLYKNLVVAVVAIAATTLCAVGETVVYVSTNGNDSASGTSEAPLKTIKSALLKGTDVVYVRAGTYLECDIELSRAVRVIGLTGNRDEVIVDARNFGRCFYVANADAVVSSLTMLNGCAKAGLEGKGGNLYMASGTVTNCVVKNGTSTQQIGISGNCLVAGGLLVDSVLEGGAVKGTYGSGFALRAEGESTRIMRCIIRNAQCSKSINYGVYLSQGAILENSLLTGLTCGGTTGRALIADNSTVVNCTVTGNSCTKSGIYLFGENAHVVNCVSVGNGGTCELEVGTGAQPSGIVACASPEAFEGGVRVNTVSDAGFNGDYSLTSESPLVAKGSLSDYLAHARSAVDLAGRNRTEEDATISIGAYSIGAGSNEILAMLIGINGVTNGAPWGCTLTVANPTTGWTAKWRDLADEEEGFTRDVAPTYTDPGLHTNAVCVSAPDYPDLYLTNVVYMTAIPVRYVSPSGYDNALGSEAEPFQTITRALTFVQQYGLQRPGKVLIKDGTYFERGFLLNAGTEVRGASGDRTKVIVDANGANRCFDLNAGAVVSSLTMKNGKNGAEGGGNIRVQGGTVTNCVIQDGISGHSYGLGGNCYITGGLLVDSVLEGGTATSGTGGGFSLRAEGESTRIMRCIIRNAQCSKDINYGVYLSQGAILENSLLTGLTCSGTTGRALIADNSTVVNCTVAGNSCTKSGIYLFGENAHVVNCVSVGNGGTCELEVGTGAQPSGIVACASPEAFEGGVQVETVDDAGFKDAANGDYSLTRASPLVAKGSAGEYALSALSGTDLAGNQRLSKSRKIDIGAYQTSLIGMLLFLR